MNKNKVNIRFSDCHEWVSGPDKNGHYKIGISQFAIKELGDIVYLEIENDVSEEIEENEVFGTIEAVKTVSDIFMPVTSTIVDINDDIIDNPELLTTESALEHWLIKVDFRDDSCLDNLLSEEEYLKAYSI